MDTVGCASGLPVDSFPSLKNTPIIDTSRVIRPYAVVAADNPYLPWVEVMKQALPLTDYDETILEHLENVKIGSSSSSQAEEHSITLHFAPEVHDYFESEHLTLKFLRRVSLSTLP